MREIKFRAWDEVAKRMIQNVSTGTIHIFDDHKQGSVPSSSCAFMQYTGLRDKNGKEIYEGDVVHSQNEGAYAVGFNKDGCWVIEIYAEHFNDDGSSTPRDASEILSNAITDYGMEVIGNIYENPDLLS